MLDCLTTTRLPGAGSCFDDISPCHENTVMSYNFKNSFYFYEVTAKKIEVVAINLQMIYFYIAIFFLRLRQQIVGNNI